MTFGCLNSVDAVNAEDKFDESTFPKTKNQCKHECNSNDRARIQKTYLLAQLITP